MRFNMAVVLTVITVITAITAAAIPVPCHVAIPCCRRQAVPLPQVWRACVVGSHLWPSGIHAWRPWTVSQYSYWAGSQHTNRQTPANHNQTIQLKPFPFNPRPVLAFGYCHHLRLCVCSCVCQSVCQSLACPRDNSGPVQARIAKFGPKMQKTLVNVPIVLGGNWPSRSNLT